MLANLQPRRRAWFLPTLTLALIPLVVALSACAAAAPPAPTAPQSGGASNEQTRASGAATSVGAPADIGVGAPAQAASGGGTTGTAVSGTTGTAVGGTGVASNPAIAYPYPGYVGVSGVAADHTIVVTGLGNAAMKADGSNRAASLRTALAAALADAKAQADLVAQATGVTIHGVLSVSVSSGQTYAIPMAVEGSAPSLGGGTTVPPTNPGVVQPAEPQLQVSVTVAYQIG